MNTLYKHTSHLNVCQSGHIYRIYSWLNRVYEGRNEFDMDYPGYLADMCRNGKVTQ